MRIRRIMVQTTIAALALLPVAGGDVQLDCRTDHGATTVTTCAPAFSPTGAPIVGGVEEDGSAAYADGMGYDATDGWTPRVETFADGSLRLSCPGDFPLVDGPAGPVCEA